MENGFRPKRRSLVGFNGFLRYREAACRFLRVAFEKLRPVECGIFPGVGVGSETRWYHGLLRFVLSGELRMSRFLFYI